MRILKYIFLLLLLALFATAVYVATQKGDFNVSRSAVIKSPRPTVFNYVNDYRNWETFGSWNKENPGIQYTYPRNTAGKGGYYAWKSGSNGGDSRTISVRENETINQKMNFNGAVSDVNWTFKDTLGGTKVTWRSKGNMSFGFKVYSVFHGGPETVIGNMYEKSLANLDKTLDYELKTYSIKVGGLVQKIAGFYLKQTITSRISDVPKNLRIMVPRLVNFFTKNKIEMYGKPFVLYHTYDAINGITKFSVCVPIKEEVFISEGSDITFGKLYAFQSVKTTLKGDYSHLKEAWDKTSAYISANHLSKNTEIPSLELYSKGINDVAYPSQWITDIYIPVQGQSEPKPIQTTPKPKPAQAAETSSEVKQKTPEIAIP